MKKNFLSITTISALTLFMVSCKDKAKEAATTEAEEVIEVAPETTYTANLEASSIAWTGYKPTGSHNGTISLESGTLSTTDGKISGGVFTIDMASIVDLDIPADKEGNAKLVGHLKSPDFFDVEKYPTAKFEITGINETDGKTMLSGNLTLKDVTNNITFPVSVSQENDSITLASETFTIDRSKWHVKFGSKSFFDDLGDKFINDDIELKINVKAAKS